MVCGDEETGGGREGVGGGEGGVESDVDTFAELSWLTMSWLEAVQ